jgi:hypothetical protein
MRRTLAITALTALGLSVTACGDNDVLTCGEGTIQQGGECIAGAPGAGLAPTITAITPSTGLVAGNEPFTITGTGFRAAGAGDTTITFGDNVAAFEIVSDSEITGTTARASAAAVSVTVTNQNGAAATDFSYTGLYLADGKGGLAGNLYLIDPRDATSVEIGELDHAVTGLAFSPDGTLYATQSTLRGGFGPGNLLTIDPETATSTIVGPLDDAGETNRNIPDITFSGTNLVGWAEGTADEPAMIDTETGAVTLIGGGTSSYGDGLATLADGTVVIAPQGAQGPLASVDLGDGAVTNMVEELQGASATPPICGLTSFRGTLYALLCTQAGPESGSVLATIDPDDGTITYLGSAPANADAIASDDPEPPAAGRFIPRSTFTPPTVAAAADESCAPARASHLSIHSHAGTTITLTAADLATNPASIPLQARRPGVRGLPLTAALPTSTGIAVVSCSGATLRLSAADLATYALVRNQRGLIKLIDTATGAPLARGITALRPAP